MSTIIKCNFCNPDIENFNVLQSILPDDYEYMVCSFNGDASHFKTRLRTSGKNNTYAQKWLEDFQMHSKCTMRVERTYPHSGTKNVFKVDLRCQHNTRPRSEKVREKESCKNTDCPAKMGITIKRVVTERKSRSKDPHLPDHPTVIQMDFCHNHAMLTPEILKHRSVLPDVKEKILTLFKFGHNPATALDMHKYDLLLEHGENFEKICHDRALLPDPQFCYRLYYKIVRKQSTLLNGDKDDIQNIPTGGLPDKKPLIPLSSFENSASFNSHQSDALQSTVLPLDSLITGAEKKAKKKRKLESTAVDKKEMAGQLEDVLCKFCESGGFAGMQLIENNTVMALCTPLMHRIHTLVKNSGEIVFVDAYGELEEPNSCRVYLLVTYSCIGAIPVGCLVTSSIDGSDIKAALEIWRQILPSGSFYNKSDGPDIFFTSDNDIERQCLKAVFPKSQLLICLSHLLQAAWTFVCDRKNTIKKDHRSHLFSKIKIILFSQSVEDLEMNYAYAIGDSLVKLYSSFVDYLKHLYNLRHDWSLVYRRHLIPRATDVAFFWESAMIVLKDPILSRTKTYNPLQIVDFLSRLDTYYERKLIDLANSRFDSVRLSRFLFIELPREAYTITQNSENEYEVHNDTKDTTYQVDITLGMCECRTGKSGAPCKHQLLVYRNFPVPIYDCIPPTTVTEKNVLLHLATGQEIENESGSDTITKAVEAAMEEPCPTPEISMPDLDTCGDNDFFLDENPTCEPIGQNSTISHPGVLTEHNSSLSLQSGTLIPTTVLEHHSSPMDPQEVTIPQHGLLSQLTHNSHQAIQLNHPVTSQLNQQLDNIVENVPHLTHNSSLHTNSSAPPPPPPPCLSISNPQSDEQSVTELLHQICLKLKERTIESPSIFKPALGTFLKNLDNLSADSSLEYALYSFGKFSKSATPLFQRKILDNKLIGFQSAGDLKKKKMPIQTQKTLKKQF